ncbi:MAG: S-layer homology domain-containing protein, partial [Clostridia bacterium]|nr:S-layer homology domain-containing protein [Clostridia bacterium]
MKKTVSVLLSLALAGSITVLPAAAAGLDHFKPGLSYEEGRFTDVRGTDWFSSHVASAYELGLLNGTGPDTFSPSGEVTLASAVALVSRLHVVYYDGGPREFNQALGQNWYDVYVEYAAESGFLNRETHRDYRAAITREQFSALLHSALPAEAFEAVNQVEDGSIPDVDRSSDYAEAVYALYRAGILTGSGDKHTFLPEDHITRAELAAITSRTADPEQRYQNVPEEQPGADDKPGSGGGNGGESAPQPPVGTPAPPEPGLS